MNKKNLKKKSKTKKYITLGIVTLFALAVVSAGLVSYLSNEAQISVNVESPVLLEVSTDGSSWLSDPAILDFGNIFGGESITFWIKDTNLASVPIVGGSEKLVTNVNGVTCDDFVSVTVNGNFDLLSVCQQIDSNTIDFSAYSSGGLAANGESGYTATNEIDLTFKQNATGNYIFTMLKMSD